MLQWGHDFSAVEIEQVIYFADAQMGPLQWGHDFSAVEIGGLFSPSIGTEKWAVFERSGKYAAVLFNAPTSSQEYSQYESASSASRPSRNHITSRRMSQSII